MNLLEMFLMNDSGIDRIGLERFQLDEFLLDRFQQFRLRVCIGQNVIHIQADCKDLFSLFDYSLSQFFRAHSQLVIVTEFQA